MEELVFHSLIHEEITYDAKTIIWISNGIRRSMAAHRRIVLVFILFSVESSGPVHAAALSSWHCGRARGIPRLWPFANHRTA
jgi:hypothetical protein